MLNDILGYYEHSRKGRTYLIYFFRAPKLLFFLAVEDLNSTITFYCLLYEYLFKIYC